MYFAIFSLSEIDRQWKEEFLEFLEKTIKEQKHEIYVLHSDMFLKPVLTNKDKRDISNEVLTVIEELFKFDKFFHKYFEAHLISESTKCILNASFLTCKEIQKLCGNKLNKWKLFFLIDLSFF